MSTNSFLLYKKSLKVDLQGTFTMLDESRSRGGPHKWPEDWKSSPEKKVGIFQPGEEKALGRPYWGLSMFKRFTNEKDLRDFIAKAYWDRIRCNGFKLKQGGFSLVLRKKFFMSVVKYWHRLYRGVVDATLFEACKIRVEQLDLVKEMYVPTCGREVGLYLYFQPKPLYDI